MYPSALLPPPALYPVGFSFSSSVLYITSFEVRHKLLTHLTGPVSGLFLK